MGNPTDDLDRFLKTAGIRIAGGMQAGPFEPLAVDDISRFASMDLKSMGRNELASLQYRLEDLRDDLEDREPADKSSEEYRLWDRRLCAVEDFLDRVLDRLEDQETES